MCSCRVENLKIFLILGMSQFLATVRTGGFLGLLFII